MSKKDEITLEDVMKRIEESDAKQLAYHTNTRLVIQKLIERLERKL